MVPLVEKMTENPVELFQICLNLPKVDKRAAAVRDVWDQKIPQYSHRDDDGRSTEITIVAGALADRRAPIHHPARGPRVLRARSRSGPSGCRRRRAGPSRPAAPDCTAGSIRSPVGSRSTDSRFSPPSRSSAPTSWRRSTTVRSTPRWWSCRAAPSAIRSSSRGPSVMNSRGEIRDTIAEYQAMQFGGWWWGSDEPVHPATDGRFAQHADGTIERPT